MAGGDTHPLLSVLLMLLASSGDEDQGREPGKRRGRWPGEAGQKGTGAGWDCGLRLPLGPFLQRKAPISWPRSGR